MKRILYILALFAFLAPAAGQQGMLLVGDDEAEPGFLDSFPDAWGAYSFYLLDKDYAGNCISVYRASTGDTTTIGFVGGYVDTIKLLSFCSGTTCRAFRWYDQSGAGNNFNQPNTTAGPIVVNAGAMVKVNGHLAAYADVTGSSWASASSLGTVSDFSIILVGAFQQVATGFNSYLGANNGSFASGDNWFLFRGNASTALQNYANSSGTQAFVNAGTPDTDQHLYWYNFIGSSSFLVGVDGSDTTDSTGIPASLNSLGELHTEPITVQHAEFYYQQLIIYTTDQTSDRSAMQSQINGRYNIY